MRLAISMMRIVSGYIGHINYVAVMICDALGPKQNGLLFFRQHSNMHLQILID